MATPCTAAIDGLTLASKKPNISVIRCTKAVNPIGPSRVPRSPMSAPPQNALPSPTATTIRILGELLDRPTEIADHHARQDIDPVGAIQKDHAHCATLALQLG